MNNNAIYALIGIVTLLYLVYSNLFFTYKDTIYKFLIDVSISTKFRFLWLMLPEYVQIQKINSILHDQDKIERILQLCFIEDCTFDELYSKSAKYRVFDRSNSMTFILSKYKDSTLDDLKIILEKLGLYNKSSTRYYYDIHVLRFHGLTNSNIRNLTDSNIRSFMEILIKLKFIPSDFEKKILLEYYDIEFIQIILKEEDKYQIL